MTNTSVSHKRFTTLGLSLGALGIVYGDIGTSPLYAINEIFIAHNTALSSASILGAISLVIWALTIVVAIKYVGLVLRADNQGEGGVFALLALLRKQQGRYGKLIGVLLVIAAGLLFGDGLITPAISVLSAVEGLKVATPSLAHLVIPITLGILTALFVFQRKGTHKVGRIFGPLILVWFLVMGALGLNQVANTPHILYALNPIYGLRYLADASIHQVLLVLGSVMLVVTGGEALYADMGHFGKKPIRLSWFTIVYPMLLLGYLGQGAFLLSGAAVKNGNIFFSTVPSWGIYPMVLLATAATVIASQALISGAFSLATQGISLKLLPRMRIVHTHADHEGQTYVPSVNWLLYVGCVLLVIAFGSSSRLAGAYGLAVSANMVITTMAMVLIATVYWHWRRWKAIAIFATLSIVDLMFLGANSIKLLEGGYIPLTIALIAYVIMTTWRWGRNRIQASYTAHSSMTMQDVIDLRKDKGRAAFPRSLLILTPDFAETPDSPISPLLQLFIDRYHSLPEHMITLTIQEIKHPHADEDRRYDIVTYENDKKTGCSIIAIRAKFGFMETPDLKEIIKSIAKNDDLTPGDDLKEWIIYVGKERLSSSKYVRRHMRIRYKLFKLLARNAEPSFNYYGLGNDQRISMELVPVEL